MSIRITAGYVVVSHKLQDNYVRELTVQEECDIALIEVFNSHIKRKVA
jgi:hypothetical protein